MLQRKHWMVSRGWCLCRGWQHFAAHPACVLLFAVCAACLATQEVNDIRAGMEKAKNDIIKSTIAIMGTFSAIAFTITRLVAV